MLRRQPAPDAAEPRRPSRARIEWALLHACAPRPVHAQPLRHAQLPLRCHPLPRHRQRVHQAVLRLVGAQPPLSAGERVVPREHAQAARHLQLGLLRLRAQVRFGGGVRVCIGRYAARVGWRVEEDHLPRALRRDAPHVLAYRLQHRASRAPPQRWPRVVCHLQVRLVLQHRLDGPHRALAVGEQQHRVAGRLPRQGALDGHELGHVAAAARWQRAASERPAVVRAPRRRLGRPVWLIGRRPVAAIHRHHCIEARGARSLPQPLRSHAPKV